MSKTLSSAVFKTSPADSTLSERTFYLILGIMVVIGLAAMGYTAKWVIESNLVLDKWQSIMIICVPFLGIFISHKSKEPVSSFMAYMMIVLPFGVLLGPYLLKFDQAIIFRTALLTGGITVLMTLASITRPEWFENVGNALFTALVCLLIIRILQIFFPILQQLKSIDYLAAGLFSLYIGYDMHRAQNVARTFQGAINIAISLYLDILNIFVSLLSIFKN